LTDKKITIAIMCYGLYGYEYRSAEEMEGLIDYFHSCAGYIAKLYRQKRLSGVVLCGGYTNKDYPDKSEAGTSLPYLQNVLQARYRIYPSDIVFCLEEESCNTAQNIVFTGMLIRGKNPFTADELEEAIAPETDKAVARALQEKKQRWQSLSHSLVFICDKYRHLKVWVMLWLASGLLRGLCLRVRSFPRKDIHPNSSYKKQCLAALYYLWHHDKFFEDLSQTPAR